MLCVVGCGSGFGMKRRRAHSLEGSAGKDGLRVLRGHLEHTVQDTDWRVHNRDEESTHTVDEEERQQQTGKPDDEALGAEAHVLGEPEDHRDHCAVRACSAVCESQKQKRTEEVWDGGTTNGW